MTGDDIFGDMYILPPSKNMFLLVLDEQLARILCEGELTKLCQFNRNSATKT